MEKVGFRFMMKDGTDDEYAPVDMGSLTLSDYWYTFLHMNGYTYEILKSDVEKLEFYYY